jgi:hypothetical protein
MCTDINIYTFTAYLSTLLLLLCRIFHYLHHIAKARSIFTHTQNPYLNHFLPIFQLLQTSQTQLLAKSLQIQRYV